MSTAASDPDVLEPAPEAPALPFPDAATWAARTLASPMVGDEDDPLRPFTRQSLGAGTLLLTRRMFDEQRRVAVAVRARADAPVLPRDAVHDLDGLLRRFFANDADGEAARAVRIAAERRLALVVGGPGTGKTFSLCRLLAVLLEHARAAGEAPAIALAAPTGKAAARMREAMREAASEGATPSLDVSAATRATLLALEAKTLHRLVGVRPDGSTRHDAARPIPARVVVVDEVSMVDLTLMRQLLEAVHPEARLVLLGDRDQLASVEAGSVLADLVSATPSGGPLAACTQAFTVSRRFAGAPDIGLVAACLQSYGTSHPDAPAGDAAARQEVAARVMTGGFHARRETHPGARIRWLGDPDVPVLPGGQRALARPREDQLHTLAAPYLTGFERLTAAGEERVPGYASLLAAERRGGVFSDRSRTEAFWAELLAAFEQSRVLAVHRKGPLGVEGLERALSRMVRAHVHGAAAPDRGRHWIGRALLVTENAYDVRLMNGDVGLVVPGPDSPVAVFPGESPGEVRAVALSRLPPHEGALAMTVHKAQGSQFERVSLVLAGRPSPIQTRELVYTGVTRAKNQLVWLGGRAELTDALARPLARESGLAALLGAG